MRPLRATLRRSALAHNIGVVRAHAPASRIWAVVKADAYGHGLMRMLPVLAAAGPAGPDGLALLELDAAVRLREAGLAKPILMLEGFFSADELALFSHHRLCSVVHSLEQVAMLETARPAAPIDIHLKLNTGMNRLGLATRDLAPALRRLRACGNAGAITVMTHFADADGPTGVAAQHARLMAALVEAGRNAGPGAQLPRSWQLSMANSAAILRYPETHADWVRPGIMLYGCTPFADEPECNAAHFGLEPVMTLSSEIIAVQDLKPGDRVGYGGIYTARQAMRIGVIACGYADGYPRHAPGSNQFGTPVLVGGRRTRTVGRVSMDMIYADLSRVPEAGVGTPVTLWGEGLSADEVADAAGTVSYELLCALAPRVPVDVVG
jgi:alanine racemase